MIHLFHQVAIFILATTRQHQKRSYLDTRIIPIIQSWGYNFENLYFVFGTNKFDWEFIQNHCILQESYGEVSAKSRRLAPHTIQVTSQNKHEVFKCFFHNEKVISSKKYQYEHTFEKSLDKALDVSSFKILWTGNSSLL